MSELSWAETVRQVHQRAENRCEYCQTAQRVMGQAMHVEHIHPDGPDALENLCLSCPSCNLSKGPNLSGVDSETGEMTRLFNPRTDNWHEHFRIQAGCLMGLTSVGRTTVDVLNINRPDRVRLRIELEPEAFA